MRSYAVWLALLAGCGSGGGFPDAASQQDDAPVVLGNFMLTWSILDSNSGSAVTCTAVGAQNVTVAAKDLIGTNDFGESFICSGGAGISMKFIPSTFDFNVSLVDGSGNVLAQGSAQDSVVIQPNLTTQLAPETFTLDAEGNLALELDSGKPGGNCAGSGSGGAGITGTTITLVHGLGSTCAPLALTIGSDANHGASTYTVNCTTPMVGPCIEKDQVISASNVLSDTYTIHVAGDIGSAACWSNGVNLAVPPNGGTLTTTVDLSYQTGSGCP